MEKLAGNVVSELLPDRPLRDIYLCSSETIESLVQQIVPPSPHFGLLLAADARSLDADRIGLVAESLLNKGLAYLCAWGPDCERVHDIFDEMIVEVDPEQNKGVILTTWHSKEPLEEALWFFVNSAFPNEAYEDSCNAWIAAPIGFPEWERQYALHLRNVALNRHLKPQS
jgi:hypothetical protein